VRIGVSPPNALGYARLPAAEIASLFQRPVLGAIPRIPGRRQTSVAERIRRAHADPHSDAAEGARSLATTLRHGSEGTSANTVLISSPLPDEGKTAASAMLATSLAQMGERVLVVDANCRRPMMHEAFAIPGTPGLVDSVNGRARLEDGIVRTGSAGAFVLPLGTAPGDPMELLNSEAFERGLGELSAQFDRVLLDAPATVPVSDARVLAAHCDATMMVLRPDRSDRRSALHARDLLDGVGARIIGSVANAAPRRSSFGWHGRIGYASGGTPADPHAADSAHAASPSQTADASDSDNGTHPADQRHGRGTTGSEQKPEGLRRPPSAGVSRP
jgi:capsular exopolysaccharide synthesis family protein